MHVQHAYGMHVHVSHLICIWMQVPGSGRPGSRSGVPAIVGNLLDLHYTHVITAKQYMVHVHVFGIYTHRTYM